MTKIFAPVIIVLSIIGQVLAYILIILILPIPLWVKIIIGIAMCGAIFALITVLVQRIKEIWEENEDDLSKY